MTALTLITAPSVEPLTTAEAKLHLRVDESADDGLIDGLILAAREQAEAFTKRALITQTWELIFDNFSNCIELPKADLQSVTSIKYIDTDGVEQTLATSVYTVDTDSEPGRVYLAYNQTWPTVRAIPHAVTIQFVAGYGAASTAIPGSILSAMKLMIGHWYENREDSIVGTIAAPIPFGSRALLGPYTIDRM